MVSQCMGVQEEWLPYRWVVVKVLTPHLATSDITLAWGCLILAGLGWKYRLASWWEWKPELYLAFSLIPPGCMAGCLVTASWGWKEIQASYTAFAGMGGGGATITLWDLVGVEQLLWKIFLLRLLFFWYFRKREQPFFSGDFSACISSDSWLLQFQFGYIWEKIQYRESTTMYFQGFWLICLLLSTFQSFLMFIFDISFRVLIGSLWKKLRKWYLLHLPGSRSHISYILICHYTSPNVELSGRLIKLLKCRFRPGILTWLKPSIWNLLVQSEHCTELQRIGQVYLHARKSG